MQQRRVRLGDILDDYCPRERRVTNHVVAAMVEDEVKQTRCTTCDSDHVYKHARVPATRRKPALSEGEQVLVAAGALSSLVGSEVVDELAAQPEPAPTLAEPEPEPDAGGPEDAGGVAAEADEDWPVHRPLIRATLPRPEGQQPERKEPDFTHRQVESRFNRGRNRRGGKSPAGHPKGQSFSQFGNSHSGQGSRHGQGGNSQRDGNRHGPPPGQHGGRPAGRGGGQNPSSRGRSRGR